MAVRAEREITDTTNSNVALVYDESTDRLTFGYSDGNTLAIEGTWSFPVGTWGLGRAHPLGTNKCSGCIGIDCYMGHHQSSFR
jgi:hypothetical protein